MINVMNVVTESEQLDVMHLHNKIKEQADEQQLEYVKKGVREGARYMHRRRVMFCQS